MRHGAARIEAGAAPLAMHPSATSELLFNRLMTKARLRQLQLLVAVADESSLRRGAEDVYMSQPAATQALAELEALLETPLFERHARGMRLTPGGEALVPAVRRMLLALRDSTAALEALQQGASGLLRVGVIAAVATALLGERVLQFCRQRPRMRVEIIEGVQDSLTQDLLAGGLHLVLGRRPVPLHQRLHFEPLRPDEAVVIAGPGHPLAGRMGLTLQDLMPHAWMRASRGLWVRGVFDDLFDRAGLRPLLHPMSVGSLGPLIEILRDNRTLSLIPGSLARTLVHWGLAVVLDARLDTPRGELGALCLAGALDNPAQADPMLVDFVAALRPDPAPLHGCQRWPSPQPSGPAAQCLR
jgi:DNA-binding transcriptional LysR family regulator